jgi:excisionase family DNA binding protein
MNNTHEESGKSSKKTNGRKMLTPRDIAALVDVDPETVRRWVRERKLVPNITTPGGRRLFTRERVDEFVRSLSPEDAR